MGLGRSPQRTHNVAHNSEKNAENLQKNTNCNEKTPINKKTRIANKSWSEMSDDNSVSSHKSVARTLVYQNNNVSPSNWTTVQSSKRGRSSPSNIQSNAKQKKLDSYWLSSNRFSPLADLNTDKNTKSNSLEPVVPKPPPIFVSGVANIQPLKMLLNEIAPGEFVLKILAKNEVKIQLKTAENYSNITKALLERKTEFHTYKLKQDRSYNVVLRGMHPSIPVEEIKEELEKIGFTVTNISNIRERVTKKPLPLFFIGLKPTENNKEIFEVQSLLSTKVKFEAPKKKRELPQCIRCQRYGHTKHFCNRTPRCVKCTGSHFTQECPRKGINKDVKCVLCDGNHPANYKGCLVYKQLQQKAFPPQRRREPDQPSTRAIEPFSNAQRTQWPNTSGRIPPNLSDVSSFPPLPGGGLTQPVNHVDEDQCVASKDVRVNKVWPTNANSNNELSELKSMLKTLMEQMGTMLNLLTAFVTKTSV